MLNSMASKEGSVQSSADIRIGEHKVGYESEEEYILEVEETRDITQESIQEKENTLNVDNGGSNIYSPTGVVTPEEIKIR